MKKDGIRSNGRDLLSAPAAVLIAFWLSLTGIAIGSDADGASVQGDAQVDDVAQSVDSMTEASNFSGIHPWDNSDYSDTSGTDDPGHVLRVGERPQERADRSETPELRKASGQAPLPRTVDLLGNYPNPFNAQTRLAFTLNRGGDVDLRILNLLGQPIRSVRLNTLSAGAHEWAWDGRGDRGEDVPSGVYFFQIVLGRDAAVHKMVLLK
jgi:hypothetical protein